jgi:WD40 repeat protein
MLKHNKQCAGNTSEKRFTRGLIRSTQGRADDKRKLDMCFFGKTLLVGTLLVVSSTTMSVVAQVAQDKKTPNPPCAMRLHTKGPIVGFCTLSPDAKTLVYSESYPVKDGGSWQRELVLVDVASGKELQRRALAQGAAFAGVFSPDGKLFACGSATFRAWVWDVETWKPRVALEGSNGLPLAFSPDGSQIAGRSGGYPVVWETATGNAHSLRDKTPVPDAAGLPRDQLGGYYDEAVAATFSDDGKVLIVEGHTANILSIKNHPFLSSMVSAWDVTKGKPIGRVLAPCCIDYEEAQYFRLRASGAPMPGAALSVNRFRVSPGGRLLVLPRYDAVPYAPLCYSQGSFALVTMPPVRASSGEPADPKKVLWKCNEFKGSKARSCYLSPDGKWLVAAGTDPTKVGMSEPPFLIVVWDVSQFWAAAATTTAEPTAKELQAYWSLLAEPDSEWMLQATTPQVLRAMLALQAHPAKLVPFLLERLGKATCDPQKIRQWIDDLDDDKFAVRDKAFAALDQLGGEALPHVDKALAGKNSPEKTKRLEQLRQRMRQKEAPGEVRALRLLDVLEHCDALAARKLLQAIADGEYWPAYALEAQAALKRTAKGGAK